MFVFLFSSLISPLFFSSFLAYKCSRQGSKLYKLGVKSKKKQLGWYFRSFFLEFLINYIITQVQEMKFKSEYRWLLFILTPFVVLLVIHIISPLMLLLNSQPKAINSYNEHNIDAIHANTRSYLQQQGSELASVMSKFASLARTLGSMLSKKWSYLGNTTKNINNAYQYYENNTGLQVNRSMWFAQNIKDPSELNQEQITYFNKYSQAESYIMASLVSDQQNMITGIFVSFNKPRSQIAFHYPSYQEMQYKNLSSSIIIQPYDLIVQSQSTFIFDTARYGGNFDNATTSLCSPIKNYTQIIGVVCIQISLSSIFSETLTEFQILGLSSIEFTLNLIEPSTNKVLSKIDHFQQFSSLSFPYNQNITSFDLFWDASSCQGDMRPQNFYVTLREQFSTSNAVAICLGGSKQKSQAPTLLYSLSFKIQNLQTQLFIVYTYSEVVKTLLIPILISIVISILLSLFILRYILNDLDFQLFKLNEYCKFIVDGDITIHIPEFVGTHDILQLYQQAKIINKLFRYTSKQYFTGYYSNKILKYVQAIQVFKKLNYDPSFLYQNIGDSYLYIQQYQKSIFYLKQSIETVENQIVSECGSLQQLMHLKLQKDYRFSTTFKQNQIVMTRRLWKIFFVYMKYVQLGMLNSKNFFGENLTQIQKKQKKDKYHAEMVKYVTKLKQIMYPDYGSLAQGTLLFQFEAKFHFSCKNFEAAKSCLEKAMKFVAIYSKEYESNGNKIKQKGSKNKFFFKKNKMSGHSRCKPQIARAFCKNIQAISKVFHPKNRDYIGAFDCLFEAVRSNYISQSVNFMIVSQIKKQLGELKIGLSKFQHTQIFRQMMPYKTLHYGPITPQIEPLLYRLPKSAAEVQLRQFVFMYDTASLEYPSAYCQKHISYLKQRSEFIFQKLVKKIDRVSINKFNNVTEVQTGCNLTLKQFNQQILKKTFKDYLVQSSFVGKTWLINGLSKIIHRVKKLQCEKVILVFLRPIQSFVNDMVNKKYRPKYSKTKKSLGRIDEQFVVEKRHGQMVFPQVGEEIVELMRSEPMRNCKLILMCSVMDQISQVIKVFGLKDINRRIWAITDGLNKNNNTVYIIDDKHKTDIQRLLGSKLANYADNHVFIFGYKP